MAKVTDAAIALARYHTSCAASSVPGRRNLKRAAAVTKIVCTAYELNFDNRGVFQAFARLQYLPAYINAALKPGAWEPGASG